MNRLQVFCLMWLCVFFISPNANASLIRGLILDETKQPMSFVNVFIKGTNTGTTCNEQGRFMLKVQAGTHEIGFQYIGYKVMFRSVTVAGDETQELNVQMTPEAYNLNEVSVQATAEDPAFPIMRQAMAMRKVYLFEPKEYSAQVYLKGMQRLTTVPKRVLLFKLPTDLKPGIFYLSESLSELSVQLPDKVKERMISSKVSGDNKAFSFNRAGAIKFNLYENLISTFGLTERGFVSPLASNAFMFYKYRLEGESKEGGHTIYKIRLLPIRNNDPVFRGHIYIVKDSWRLHSTDLALTKNAQLEFVDTLYIKQVYAEQAGGVWMPTSQRFIFQFEAYGFRGNGYFVAAYSKYKVNSMYPPTFYGKQQQQIAANDPVPQVRRVKKQKVEKRGKASDSSLFSPKHFNNEVLSIDRVANKTDDSVWDSIRPVPLTEEEQMDYHTKDSIRVIEESKPYLDSIDRINNKLDWADVFVTGYSFDRSYARRSFRIDPLIAMVQFNTVEGWVLNPGMSLRQDFDDNRYWEVSPNLRYGFASQRFYGQVSADLLTDPIGGTHWRAGAGHFVEQINRAAPISPLLNTGYTLIAGENYLKEYERTFGRLGYQTNLFNGVSVNASADYAQRTELVNNTLYSFVDINNRHFTRNAPVSREMPFTSFPTHKAMTVSIGFNIRFAQRYITRPDERYYFRSKYPSLNITYTKGVNNLGSTVDFDKLTFSVSHNQDFGLFGDFAVKGMAGTFLNSSVMYFMDYQHFNGNRTIFAWKDYRGFQLLDYYQYSTRGPFAEVHAAQHFNGFLFNKIPLFRKLKWQEVLSMNYLKTSVSPHYIELGAGIEHIFRFIRADFFLGFEDGNQVRSGILVGLGF